MPDDDKITEQENQDVDTKDEPSEFDKAFESLEEDETSLTLKDEKEEEEK